MEPKGTVLREAALVIVLVLFFAFSYLAGAKNEGTSAGVYNRTSPTQTK